jgi:protein-tyrosine-phosphatase
MAEGLCTAIAHKLGLLEVQATSAGIAATEGSFPSPHAASVMREMGIAISKHRARQLNSEMAHHVDLILAMTPQHVKQALAIVGAAVPVRTLGDYAGVREAINDPFGGTAERYRRIVEQIQRLLTVALSRLGGAK